ncbi:hypothetical protein QBC39DRAFT_433787 [Podospora conica]|nr:hypothetical protein QBC39DRAFT_433787 [Schizothecium conicum]
MEHPTGHQPSPTNPAISTDLSSATQTANIDSKKCYILRMPSEILWMIFEELAAHYENKPTGNPGEIPRGSSCISEFQFPYDSEGPPWSIMAVRLTCGRFSDLSSHLLIRSLHLDLSDDSLQLLHNVSTHPIFSRSVLALRVSIHEHRLPSGTEEDDKMRWSSWLRYHMDELKRCLNMPPSDTKPANYLFFNQITRVADAALLMMARWDYDGHNFPHFQELKRRLLERQEQQQTWLPKLAEFATAIGAALQRMPRATIFEVGDYDPDMYLEDSVTTTQRFHRYRELLGRPSQPNTHDDFWDPVFRSVLSPALLRPLSRSERNNVRTTSERLGVIYQNPIQSPIQDGVEFIWPLLGVAAKLPYMVAERAASSLTQISIRISNHYESPFTADLSFSEINMDWVEMSPSIDSFNPAHALRHIKAFSLVCDKWFLWLFATRDDYHADDHRRLYGTYLDAPHLEDLRISVKTFGGEESPLGSNNDNDAELLLAFFTSSSESELPGKRPWIKTLRTLSLWGVVLHFQDFKKALMLFKGHGSFAMLQMDDCYIKFSPDAPGFTHDVLLDALRETWPHYFDYACQLTVDSAYKHSLPGPDGTPDVLSPAELYVMGKTDENPTRVVEI